MNTNGSFGNWLKQRRKALDLTQADLADQVGCSLTTIRKIEADRRRPSRQISERMADVLAISLEDRASFVNFARRVVEAKAVLSPELAVLTPTSNLPPQLTPFIGRKDELAQIADRLNDPACRLLTLVGPGGIGKTRLALQAAADRVGEYADGVFLVSLTPVGSTTLISAAIASALQVSFYGQEDPDAQIVNYLRSKHLLLVLDNYEHLLGGIGLLADMLASAPRLKLLVTSRERLNMQEEWALPVVGLPYPGQDTNGHTGSYDAIELFVQTARRMEPNFALAGHEAAVADICRAVEGMPLGLELAATWLRVMPCDQIAGQIHRDLDFLTTPLRNVEARHRSLRIVFEHSWGLLSPVERDTVMRLSVFRGDCDLEAAEQVTGATLWLLAGLVDKSLVRLNPAGRYEMHELLRQFAADKLLESGQTEATRYRHLQFFLELAEHLEPQLFGPQCVVSMDRLEIGLDNFRAALDWAAQAGAVESGLRLAGALGWFWNRRTHWAEGRTWLETFLAAVGNIPTPIRAKALHHVLELSCELGDRLYAVTRAPEAIALAGEVDDQKARAWLLTSLEYVVNSQQEALIYGEEALALFHALGDQWGICESLGRLASKVFGLGQDFARAIEMKNEAIRLARQAGDKSVLAFLLWSTASRDKYQGRVDRQTETKFEECLTLFQELRYKNGVAMTLCGLAQVAHARCNDEQAKALLEQSIVQSREINNWGYITYSLIEFADIFSTQGEAKRAVRILGAIQGLYLPHISGLTFMDKFDRLEYERILNTARAHLDDAAFAAAFAAGQAMTLDRAIALALSDTARVEAV